MVDLRGRLYRLKGELNADGSQPQAPPPQGAVWLHGGFRPTAGEIYNPDRIPECAGISRLQNWMPRIPRDALRRKIYGMEGRRPTADTYRIRWSISTREGEGLASAPDGVSRGNRPIYTAWFSFHTQYDRSIDGRLRNASPDVRKIEKFLASRRLNSTVARDRESLRTPPGVRRSEEEIIFPRAMWLRRGTNIAGISLSLDFTAKPVGFSFGKERGLSRNGYLVEL